LISRTRWTGSIKPSPHSVTARSTVCDIGDVTGCVVTNVAVVAAAAADDDDADDDDNDDDGIMMTDEGRLRLPMIR